MELTPKLLTDEVDFRIAFRGYDQDEVDDFLERVAEAVGQLLDQLGQAVDRARTAESRLQKAQLAAATKPQAEEAPAAPAGPTPDQVAAAKATEADLNEELRRTLVLAQRTADTAIAEAREEAEKISAEARERAERTVSEADAEARRRSDEAKGRLLSEVAELERIREAVRSDVGLLERHLGEQRARVRETVQVLRRVVEDPNSFEPVPVPPLSGISAPEPAPGVAGGEAEGRGDGGVQAPSSAADEGSPAGEASSAGEGSPADARAAEDPGATARPAPEPAPVADSAHEASPADDKPPVRLEPAGEGSGTEVPRPAPEQASASAADRRGEAGSGERPAARAEQAAPRLDLRTPATSRPEPSSEPSARHDLRSLFSSPEGKPESASWKAGPSRPDQGPHTQPVAATRVEEEPDDAFLAELRKAMTEEEPLGPRDGIDSVPFAAPQAQPRTTRFGRRR